MNALNQLLKIENYCSTRLRPKISFNILMSVYISYFQNTTNKFDSYLFVDVNNSSAKLEQVKISTCYI